MDIADTGDQLILRNDTRELAYLHYCVDENVEIQHLYTDHPNKGYGTLLVKALRTKYPNLELVGIARPSISPFWVKQGAVFSRPISDEDIEDDLNSDEESAYYEQFTIPVEY